MTADWEEKLSQIEHGQYTPEQFMEEIAHMITDLVNTYEIVEGAEALMRRNQNIGICPHCGSEVVAREKGWMCRNRECRFVLWKNSAYFKRIGKPMRTHGCSPDPGKAAAPQRLPEPAHRQGLYC